MSQDHTTVLQPGQHVRLHPKTEKKKINRITIRSIILLQRAIRLWVYIQKQQRRNFNIYLYAPPLFLVALITTAKRWKQHQCPSTEEQRIKMWQRKEILHVTAQTFKEINNVSLGCIQMKDLTLDTGTKTY